MATRQPKATPETAETAGVNCTFQARRAARLTREAEHGTPPRRKLSLRAGDNTDNHVTITAVNDDNSGSPT